MKYKIALITIMIFALYGSAVSKTSNRIETDDHLYWQPGVKVAYEDYKGVQTANIKKLAALINTWTFCKISILAALDVPQSTDIKNMAEKAYFAPVFRKNKSYTLYDDPAEFKIDQINFDLAEICARLARKKLDSIFAANDGKYGSIMYYYFHCKVEMQDNFIALMEKFSLDYMVFKRAGAIERWKKMTLKLLEETNEYATKPIDCERFITSKPVVKDYILAPTVFVTEADRDKDLQIIEHSK